MLLLSSTLTVALIISSPAVLGAVVGNAQAATINQRSVAEQTFVPGLAEFPIEKIVCKSDGAIFTKIDIFKGVAVGVPDQNYIDPHAYRAFVVNDKQEDVRLYYRYTNLPGSVRIYEVVHDNLGQCDVYPETMKIKPDELHGDHGQLSDQDHEPFTEEHSDNIAEPTDVDESS